MRSKPRAHTAPASKQLRRNAKPANWKHSRSTAPTTGPTTLNRELALSMRSELFQRLQLIDWSNYETAYGPAVNVPKQLSQLLSHDRKERLSASHLLWCGLCHQHANISSAALPAWPYIFEAFSSADDQLMAEILDIVWGFVQHTGHREFACDKHGHWHFELRQQIRQDMAPYAALVDHKHSHIARFSTLIFDDLRSRP